MSVSSQSNGVKSLLRCNCTNLETLFKKGTKKKATLSYNSRILLFHRRPTAKTGNLACQHITAHHNLLKHNTRLPIGPKCFFPAHTLFPCSNIIHQLLLPLHRFVAGLPGQSHAGQVTAEPESGSPADP